MDFYKYEMVCEFDGMSSTTTEFESFAEFKANFDDERIKDATNFDEVHKVVEEKWGEFMTVYEKTWHRYYWIDVNLPIMKQIYYEFERFEDLLQEFDGGMLEEYEEFEDFTDWYYEEDDYFEKTEKAEEILKVMLRCKVNMSDDGMIVTVGHLDREVEETVFLKNPKC